ncbi:diaminopropionate ammonia-lyase [Elioraea sp.]|uniref:diaminopropionate ammonia-lyase n=1 Tax=Elioraea sp. TaxID=2185103 RepID=UPI0021DE42BD|nr:diaminopropionate ammonia-lyase [Elioraea sp.]GIX08793.1 MAG: PLP-dependent lyase/thiolase [Elioraea sp.]
MTLLPPLPFRLHVNALKGRAGAPVLDDAGFRAARDAIASWPGYAPTPLIDLPGLARALGVGALRWKDEGGRFGLGSFKALGGAYAVARHLVRTLAARGIAATDADLAAGRHADLTRDVTIACATDGNHGRSVAWGAQRFHCRAVIYIHETVSEGRADAIARFGAEVRRVPGTYDDAVRRAAEDAAAHGWTVVSDTSWPGYTEIPRDVMQGYRVMADEAFAHWAGPAPTHLFVQGGVGGVAAAVAAQAALRFGAAAPRLIVVEPDRFDCLWRSAVAGRPTPAPPGPDTIMAGLACGEVSILAFDELLHRADAFMAVPDEAVAPAMQALARGVDGDPQVVAGESAVAGLIGLALALGDRDAAAALALDVSSRVLLFGTEGATDPALYARLVGASAPA